MTALFVAELKPAPAIVSDIIQKTVVPPTPTPLILPPSYEIPMKLHMFQSFNNCGPATLSMALSYMGMDISQEELGSKLRPYQIPGGDNDDKSVTLQEVAKEAEVRGLVSYLRPNGSIQKLKRLISQNIPVITRTWLKQDEDIGHYRIVRGYNDTTQEIIQDDSFQGKNLRYSYSAFEELWKTFNYEYLVIVTEDKKQLVEDILGEELSETIAWQNAKKRIEEEQKKDPENWHLTFALSRIYYYLKDYSKSVEEYDKVENKISFRTLWYQNEPIYAIYKNGDHARTLSLISKVLENQNRAYSELYLLRGDIYSSSGNKAEALEEYKKAVFYNENNEEAKLKANTYSTT